MNEQEKTLHLWLLECREGYLTRLFTFYAIDRDEAEHIVNDTLSKRPELVHISLVPCPDGFTVMHFQRPGILVCKE